MIRAESRRGPLDLAQNVGGLAAVGAAALVLIVGLANGGYHTTTWGWIALVLAWAACLALLLRDRVSLSGLEAVALGALTLFVGWVAASIVWSDDRSQSVAEVERDLVYVLGLLAGLLVVRRSTVPHLLAGLLAGVAAVDGYALTTRLFPEAGSGVDPILVNQLSRPIGYSNGLGILSVIGIVLALGFVAHGRAVWGRVAAAAVLPVLFTTLYFTYSRGAWIALFAALVASVVLDPRRLQLLTVTAVVAPWSALAVFLSSREDGLTSFTGSYSEIRAEGRYVSLLLVLAAIASAVGALLVARVESRIRFGAAARIAAVVALVLVALVVAGVGLYRFGVGAIGFRLSRR